jgi:nitric oxide reductase large subunit
MCPVRSVTYVSGRSLLILEAIQQRQLIKDDREFKYGPAYTYIIGAAFWNFVGAGVFGGGTLNAPLVNYYEHGTLGRPAPGRVPPCNMISS